MKKYLRNSKLLLPLLSVSLFFCTAVVGQKTWTRAAGNDNWNSANNWNPAGVPTASDPVIIPDNALFTLINVNINASCASLTINGGIHPLTITIKLGATLNVTNTSGGTGLVSIGAPADGSSDKIINMQEYNGLQQRATLNCVALTMSDIILPFSDNIILDIGSGIVAISGNLTLNGSSTENEVKISQGKLIIGGTFNNGGNLVTGFSTGTVEYNGVNQVMRSAIYNNLTVSGSGGKSTAVTVNGKLSIQGTATVSNTITYGSNATLEYKGSTAQITSNFEFPANMSAKVIIDNPAAVGLNSNKTIATELTLLSGTLIAGNKLSMGANATPVIIRSGGNITGTLQSPANDYDVIYTGNSKTTGPELSSGGLKNITVNLSAATETLTLDQNRVPDGALTVSSGIFNLSSFTINRSAPNGILTVADAATLKIGAVNSLPLNYTYILSSLSVVEYAGTNQIINAITYGQCVASGSGTKTVSTAAATYIMGKLTIQTGVVFTVGGADFKVGASTIINGTLNSTSTTGTKGFAYMNINSGGLFNSIVNEDYEVFGGLIINPSGSFIAGLGKWTFSAPFFDLIKGTATFNSVYLNRYYHLEGNLSFSKLEISPGGTITNKDTMTISESLIAPCIFYQLENSVLNFGGTTFKVLLFKPNVAGNSSMVNFTRQGDQSIFEDTSPNLLPPGQETEYNYYFENLTFSGSGIKRFDMLTKKANINGKLSIQGISVVNTAVNEMLTFGNTSTLEYAGIVPQTTTDVEFKNTGGPENLIINNPSGVTLHASRSITGTVTLANGILNIPAPNILTITNGNAIGGTGFGTAKHINTRVLGATQGVLRVDKIAAASPYLFPLGNGSHYLPCTLTASDAIANNTFSAAVFEGITNNGLPNGSPIVDKSNVVDAVWTINNNISNTTLPVDITLSWSGLEGINFSTLADNLIGIAHYDNPVWGDFTGSGNQLNNTAARLGVTTFSSFAVGKLGVFNSLLRAAQHSSAIAMLAPGTTYKDLTNPDKSTAGKKNMQLMSVFPNPVSNKIQLSFAVSKNDKVELTIISADGKPVYSRMIRLQPGKNISAIDVSGFLKGAYFATALFEDGQISSIRFIK